MNDLFQKGKEVLKDKAKKKILIWIGGAVAANLPIIITVICAMLCIFPFLQAAQNIQTYKMKVQNFFQQLGEKTVNVFEGRGFNTIDEKDIEKKEKQIYDKLNTLNNEYMNYAQLDIPLIAATIYYPMSMVYDENSIEKVNIEDEKEYSEQQKKELEETYDYYKRMIKKDGDIDQLARHSISETATEYECKEITAGYGGKSTTYITQGSQIGQPVTSDFDGTFKNSEYCSNDTKSITVYTYQADKERYDNYLKTYIYDRRNKEYEFPSNLTEVETNDKIKQIIFQIHDLSSAYTDILGANQVAISQFSSLCTNGIVVAGGNSSENGQGVFSLEDYVAGVIAHENAYQDPKDPSNLEAMKAQAIATRTYTLARTDYCTKPIRNGTEDQTFFKSKINDSRCQQAVQETAGMILTYNGKIFSSEYDAYYCTEVAVCLAGGTCTCEYTKEPGGEKHTVSMPTNAIRWGGGGHGRGMSQELSDYMQTTGSTYDQILKYFYSPGVEITQSGGAENGIDGSVTVNAGVFILPSGENSGMNGSEGTGPSGFNIYFWDRLNTFFSAAKKAGYKIWYTDAWRSYDAQVQCREKKGDLCATPGRSMHGWGIAADLNFYSNQDAKDWAHAHAGEFGLDFAVCKSYPNNCKEDWHIQPIEIMYQ